MVQIKNIIGIGIILISIISIYFIWYTYGSSTNWEEFDNFNYMIYVDDVVIDDMKELYTEAIPNEFLACLYGTVNSDSINITALHTPFVYSASPIHISTSPCKRTHNGLDYLGFIHSHPTSHRCEFSDADNIESRGNGDLLQLLICREDTLFMKYVNYEIGYLKHI